MKLLRLLKKQDFLASCLLIFISLLFFWKFFLKGLVPIPADLIVGIYYPWRDYIWNGLIAGVPFKNGLLSDVVSIIYPWRLYGIELMQKGIWPLWIPQALGGAPLLANFQSGLFYPFNFLFFIFSKINAWSIYIILQPVLASLFCFIFLRNLKLQILPSLIGGLIFAFSGFNLVWLEYGIVGHAGLWLPLILLTIDKLFNKPSGLWVAIGALATGFSLLAGYPQIAAFSLVVAVLYLLFKIFWAKEKVGRRSLLLVFGFLFLGTFLAAVQLLPGLELWRLSIRGADPTAAAFHFGLNPLKNLILFLAPDFYGNPATGNFWGWGAYNESVSYISVAGLLMAITALLSYKKNKIVTFFKILLLASLLMVFANPLSNFIFSLGLPILASASAGRFLFLVDFSLAILAAYGVELLFKKDKRKVFFFSLGFIVFLFLIFLVVIFLKPDFWPDKDLLTNLTVVKRNLILPTIFLLISLVLVIIIKLKPFSKMKKAMVLLLFLLVTIDLFRFGFKYTPFSHKDYLYPPTSLIDFLKNQSGLYRFYGLIPQSMFIPYNLFSPEGYEPLMIKRYSEFANQINEENFLKISAGSRWVIVNRQESPLLNLLGAKYLLSFNSDPVSEWDPQYFKYPKEKYELVFQYSLSQVYENKEVLPRAFIVHDFQVLGDEETLRTLTNKDFNPRETLLLEEKPLNLPEEELGEDEVIINENSYFNNQILIRTKNPAAGFLFLSDNFYPGWRAFVDNQPTKIYRANYTFRAVFLPKGEHEIRFIYDPKSFKIGVLISFTSFLLLSALTLISLRKKR